MTGKLQEDGYIPFDKGSGRVRWVREDLTGGTIPTSPQLRAAFDRLRELGYKPVVGQNIGFDFYPHPALDVFDSHLTGAKKAFEALGLSPENIPSADIGFDFKMRFHRYLQEAIDNGKIQLPVYYSAHTVMADLVDKDLFTPSHGLASVIYGTVGRRAAYRNANIERASPNTSWIKRSRNP